jgi:hypothetical protein
LHFNGGLQRDAVLCSRRVVARALGQRGVVIIIITITITITITTRATDSVPVADEIALTATGDCHKKTIAEVRISFDAN